MTTNIFSIGLSGLQAANLGIATSSENISNSTTAGYTVESPVYAETNGQNMGSGYLGNGVSTTTIQRAYSQYLTTQLNNATSTNSSLTASQTLAQQLANLVGSPTSGIATSISGFFSGLQNVANAPADTATRQTALSDAQTLADQLNSAGQQYDSMRTSVNTQITEAVTQINSYSKQIAQLNAQITAASSSGQQPLQLEDQRDQTVANLSKLVGVQVVQNSGGYSLFLGNGQPLVVSTQSYNLTTAPSNTNPADLTVEWAGLPGTTAAPQQLGSGAIQGGTLGGLTSFLTQTLDPAEAQLGAIATSFAAQVNGQNALGINLAGAAGTALFNVNSALVTGYANNTGNAALSVTLTNPTTPTTDNYALSYNGGTYTLTDVTTSTVVGTTTTAPSAGTPFVAGGLSITATSGAMNSGDTYSIEPTMGALNGFSVATTNPADIAAASPVLVSASTSNAGTATVTQGTVTSGYAVPATPLTLTYTAPATGTVGTLSGFPANAIVTVTVPGQLPVQTTMSAGPPAVTSVNYDSSTGATISVTGPTTTGLTNVSFTMSGAPANNDTFTIAANTSGSQDGRNALAISNLTSSTVLNGTTTLTSAYANYVNSIGNTATLLQASSTSQQSLVTQLTSQQQSVQGVNLDEEAAKLMQYQQLYQANSKVIQTAASLFQTLIGIFQ
ncbi:flagellar hook-associated protein FlgK [Paraburkholderia dinghuensis]|uniref:Flagellar hook-associated protein 1 n=1 Tax=Paraburkholderia dinghuensis TaxID=2305225 RepID=A0A3N6MPZ1_9BURK|nr:flagellar hook-associated protein FlgK [Paraburkholderia dinghuensis]RQH06024.1 flagellar hook-associated protein FlgK [Paraburkholderia dinghuensis]